MRMARAGPDRASALAALHARAFEAPWSDADIAEVLNGPGALALESAEGFILLRAAPGGEAEVLTLAVAPEARRRGAGRALLRAGVALAQAAGAEVLFLEVAADNAPALGLYAGEGFTEVGRRRGYYPRARGEPAADALVLRRALPSPNP